MRLVDFPFASKKRKRIKKSISRCKNTFLLSRFHWQSLRRDGICMIPENWTAPRLTRDIYSTVRSRRCTLVEKYMCPCPLCPFAFGIVYDSSAGVEGKLDYRRSNTESDQIAWKGLHPSSSSVRRSRPTNTHGAHTRSVQFFLLIAKFCISTISGRRYGSSFTLRSNCINVAKLQRDQDHGLLVCDRFSHRGFTFMPHSYCVRSLLKKYRSWNLNYWNRFWKRVTIKKFRKEAKKIAGRMLEMTSHVGAYSLKPIRIYKNTNTANCTIKDVFRLKKFREFLSQRRSNVALDNINYNIHILRVHMCNSNYLHVSKLKERHQSRWKQTDGRNHDPFDQRKATNSKYTYRPRTHMYVV